jgi:hypothetical protein
MPHTPIDHLLPESTPTDDQVAVSPTLQYTPDDQVPPVVSQPLSVTSHGKESAPIRLAPEHAGEVEDVPEAEATPEDAKEGEKSGEKKRIKIKNIDPKIPADAAAAGLKTVSSAAPFPSVYDVKVPLLTDEQIIEDLKASPLTGTRWLAELASYILWKAHIQLRKIGDKVVRQRRADDPSLITRLKRIFWY